MLDLDQLGKGQTYDELKETYVIFLCKESIGKEFKDVIYTFRNEYAEHPRLLLNDKAYTMIINASGDTSGLSLEMQEFMRLICTGEATGTKDNFVHRLSSIVENNCLHEKWRSEYMRFELKMQEQYRAGLAEGREEGSRKKSLEIWTRLVEQLGEEAALKIMPNPFSDVKQEV